MGKGLFKSGESQTQTDTSGSMQARTDKGDINQTNITNINQPKTQSIGIKNAAKGGTIHGNDFEGLDIAIENTETAEGTDMKGNTIRGKKPRARRSGAGGAGGGGGGGGAPDEPPTASPS